MSIAEAALFEFEPVMSTRPVQLSVLTSPPPKNFRLHEGGNSPWLQYVVGRLNEIAHSQHGDYSSVALASIRAAAVFFPENAPTPSVVPSEDDCIQFVWHRGGYDIEFEVGHGDLSVWISNRETGASRSGNSEEDHLMLRNLLQTLGN